MKERIARLIGNGMEARLVLGTFHSVCRRYLVCYGHLIGIRKGFGIADSSDTSSIIKRIIKRLNLNIEPKRAQARISSSKSHGISYVELVQEGAKKKNADNEEFVRVFEAYESQLENSNLLDYDDLLLRCVDLLRQHPQCVSNVEVVLIDEFQDTNLVQFDLMRLFAARHKRVTTVGDPDQSIYGWRSAEIKNLRRMQKQYPDTLVINLEDNYRSSGAILLAAREVIEQDESRVARPLLPTHCPGTVPVLRRLPSAEIEASWMISEIVRSIGMTGSLLAYSDFAILLRSASLSRTIESAMGKAGLPYRMVGGQRFFDRIEIKVLLDYLRVTSQPDNNDALARIINVPPRGLGATTVKALLEEAEARGKSLWALARDVIQGHATSRTRISKTAEQRLSSLINIFLTAKRKMVDTATSFSPEDLLKYIIKKLEFQVYLQKAHENDHEARWANVEELLAQASDNAMSIDEGSAEFTSNEELLPHIEGLEQNQGNSAEEALSKFLANVALATELQREDEPAEEEAPKARVVISTIHAAKGLEWPVVFIPSAYEGSLPHSRAEDTDEERRLLYVAMTRAQALLYLSCPMRNSQRGKQRLFLTLRFSSITYISLEETKLSHFLSSKNVSRYLANQGPILDLSTVGDISRILRRKCPMEDHILEGCRTIQNVQDNLWPLDGTEEPEAAQARWNKWNENTYATSKVSMTKRRKVAHEEAEQKAPVGHSRPMAFTHTNITCSIGTMTTMQNSSSFSTHHTEGGFVSAAVQLQQDEQEWQEHSLVKRSLKREKVSSLSIRSEGTPSVGNCSTTSNHTDTQGTLLSFFSKGKSHHESQSSMVRSATVASLKVVGSGGDPMESHRDLKQLGQSTTLSAQTAILSQETIGISSRKPLTAIPYALGNHKLPPINDKGRPCLPAADDDHPSKQYVFLSSSPPPAECVPEKGETENKDQSLSIIDASKPQLNTQMQNNYSRVRPAATFHTTSVAKVQADPNVYKKTLGVRRSMTGWANRANKGFSVPSKAGGDG